jgi:hypothetical protein
VIRFLSGAIDLSVMQNVTPDVEATQPTINCISEAVLTGVNSENMKLTANLHRVLRTIGAMHLLPPTPSCMHREECTFMFIFIDKTLGDLL